MQVITGDVVCDELTVTRHLCDELTGDELTGSFRVSVCDGMQFTTNLLPL